jgi:hypothetical protein
MAAARTVIVWQHDGSSSAPEERGVLVEPGPGPHRTCRSDEAQGDEGVRLRLALGDVDRVAGRDRIKQLRQPVGHSARAG